jgi:hypothetical protein
MSAQGSLIDLRRDHRVLRQDMNNLDKEYGVHEGELD